MARQRKKPTRRGATSQRKKPAAKNAGAGGFRLPGWLWALLGMVAGFFLAQHQNGTAPWQDTRPPQTNVAPADSDANSTEAGRSTESGAGNGSEKNSGQDNDDGMPTFEFYTLLPESEVIAPGGAVPSDVDAPEPPADSGRDDAADDDPIARVIAAKSHSEDDTSTSESRAPTEPGRYMLQAASFREPSDAQKLRSRLQNLSLLANISEVEANGVTWHRVQVGPYEDTNELTRAQDLMATQGIEPLLIQLQD